MRDSEYNLVLLHDFLNIVKDWMFHNLLLNLDKTRIIHGEEKAQKSSDDFSLSFSIWPHALHLTPIPPTHPPSCFSRLISLFLSLSPFYSLFVVFFIWQTKRWVLSFGQSHLEAGGCLCFWLHLHTVVIYSRSINKQLSSTQITGFSIFLILLFL